MRDPDIDQPKAEFTLLTKAKLTNKSKLFAEFFLNPLPNVTQARGQKQETKTRGAALKRLGHPQFHRGWLRSAIQYHLQHSRMMAPANASTNRHSFSTASGWDGKKKQACTIQFSAQTSSHAQSHELIQSPLSSQVNQIPPTIGKRKGP